MKKIGPLFVMFNGVVSIILGVLGILEAQELINIPSFLGDYQKSLSNITDDVTLKSSVIYGITIGMGALQLSLGYRSFKNPKGIISGILLVIFGVSIGLMVWNSWQAKDWPISTIINLSISAAAFIGLQWGLFGSKE